MIQSKKINIIVAAAVVFALLVSVGLMAACRLGTDTGIKNEPEYATQLFGADIISIEIVANESDWKSMLDNAMNEEFIMADVIVNGKKFNNIGIRPKGNSSLMQVASSDSDRYSFRLQFDEYVKGQTCFGLDSFVVNNMLGDNTYMKEYVSYELMKEVGVDAPYYGFANIKVNGEEWGLYLAVELYNDSYEQRVFGDTSGMLYNVKSMDMGGGGNANNGGNAPSMPDFQGGMPQMPDSGQIPQMPDGGQFPQMPDGGQFPQMPDGGQFSQMPDFGQFSQMFDGQMPQMPSDGQTPQQPAMSSSDNSQTRANTNNSVKGAGIFGGRGGSGGSLEYSDDDPDSYGSIFNNVIGKGTESDYKRVIKALKALSEGENLETYFDVDQILRYLAAHTFVVNLDSYSSSMAQNYYLYERDGQITILPWDYNLSWGGFQSGNASSVINFPIDTPVSGVNMSSRPLIDKLLSNPEYSERYHSYLQQLVDSYFADGKFEAKINELDALISEYVKNDKTAFCTYEQYKTAVSAFITLGNLRVESVQGQLDGSVPATTAEQTANPDKLISAGDFNLSVLGSMMGGGGRGGNSQSLLPSGSGGSKSETQQDNSRTDSSIPSGSETESTESETQPNKNTGSGSRPGGSESETQPNKNTGSGSRPGGNKPDRTQSGTSFTGFPSQSTSAGGVALYGFLSILLIGAIIFAARFKKSY